MLTEASKRALDGLRDPHTIEWYAVPLFAFVAYVYAREMKEARRSGDWDAVTAGLTLFGMDLFNETLNGFILNLTNRSALWTAPGKTALRVMVGLNFEIMCMFAIAGIIYVHTLSDDKKATICGIRNDWFWALAFSALCVAVELLLNAGGHLVWEYPFWGRSFGGVWLIFLLGYLHFFVAIILVLALRTARARAVAVASIYGVTALLNVIGFHLLGYRY